MTVDQELSNGWRIVRCRTRTADARTTRAAATHVASMAAGRLLGEAPMSILARPGRGRVAISRFAAVPVSVSHRDREVVAAAAPAPWRIGVDVERDESIAEERARYFLSDEERRHASALSLATLWAVKEAAWKALELGPHTHFRALRLCFSSSRLHAVRFDGRTSPAKALISVAGGYVLALVGVRGAT